MHIHTSYIFLYHKRYVYIAKVANTTLFPLTFISNLGSFVDNTNVKYTFASFMFLFDSYTVKLAIYTYERLCLAEDPIN